MNAAKSRILVGKPEGKRPLGTRHRWVDNIKMDLREMDSMDWIDVGHVRDQWRTLVNMVMNLWVPLNPGKLLSNCTIGSFSKRAQLHALSEWGIQENMLLHMWHSMILKE
jgi:hypothetical protein